MKASIIVMTLAAAAIASPLRADNLKQVHVARLAPARVVEGPGALPEVSQWCGDVAGQLGDALNEAGMDMQKGDLSDAKIVLDQALIDASMSLELSSGLQAPLTKTLVDRGISLSHALDRTMGASDLETMSKVNFLSGFVRLVIDKAVQMDRNYYLPYYYQYGRCHEGCGEGFDIAAFQQQLIEYGRDLLRFTNAQLTIVREDGAVFPSGDPRTFLTVAEMVADYVACDISSTLSAYANACVIGELERLSHRIDMFMNGAGGYPTYPAAVAMVYGQIQSVVDRLDSTSCYR